jgi:zinc protease
MLDIQVAFAAGSARDGELQAGIANLTNQMLTEGAGDLNADQIASGFESVGAQLQPQVGREVAKLHLRSVTAPTQLTPALKLFTQLLSKPTFPAVGFERQKKSVLNNIREQAQKPDRIASNGIFQSVYGNHPYAHAPLGTQKTVSTLTPASIKAFFKKYYVAENAVISIVGAVDRKQAESIASDISSQLKRGSKASKLSPADSASVAVGVKQISHPSSQTHVRLGTIGMSVGDPDFFPLQIGNHILGGGMLTSHLFKEVREKRGLSYQAGSAFAPLSVPGPFIIQLQTETKQTKTALDVAKTVVQDFITKGPTQEELVAAKKNIAGGFVLRMDSNAAILEQLTQMGFYQLPLDYLDTYVEHINAVTVAQVKDAFKRRIVPESFAIVLVGSAPADASPTTKR